MVERQFEPMAGEALTHVSQIEAWPMLASPKLDGYRCVIRDGARLRSMELVTNLHVRAVLSKRAYEGFDGEITVGPPNGHGVLGRTQSGLKKVNGTPDFTFWVFDDFSAHGHDFSYRIGRAEDRIYDLQHNRIKLVEHTLIHSAAGMVKYEQEQLAAGYEGIVLRRPDGPYKFGRSTPKEGYLWKLKRFIDGEALVLGVLEGRVNTNEALKDALGRTKRSTVKAGMHLSGQVGTVLARDLKTNQPMALSPGRMTHTQRRHYFQHPEDIVGTIAVYKAFDYGVKDALRFALWQRTRDPADMPKGSSARARGGLR